MQPLDRALQSLDGLSVGDAFGQCFFLPENSDERVHRQEIPDAPWYFTDDTEMSLSIVSILARHGKIEQTMLARSLAEHYTYDRAYGPSMHRVLGRIRNDEAWQTVASSTFHGQGSFGNGAAMRAAPLGAFFAHDLSEAIEQAALSAEVTHAHPEGIAGAVAVALAAAHAFRLRESGQRATHGEFIELIVGQLPPSEVRSKLMRAKSIATTRSRQFAVSVLGNGTGMSAQDTVPYALWCCGQALEDYPRSLWLAVSAGGDRDTLCAIVGGVVASYVGSDGIPDSWRNRREALPSWHISTQPLG